MSQPAAAFCIHTPTLETTVASHSTVKAGWRKGDSVEPSVAGVACSLLGGTNAVVILTSPARSVAPLLAHVQPRHQQKAADQTKMLEKLVLHHEAAARREFPEPVCKKRGKERESGEPQGT